MPGGVIGNTREFGSRFPGSSPGWAVLNITIRNRARISRLSPKDERVPGAKRRGKPWLGSMYMFNACLTALKIGRLGHAERFVRKLRFCKVHLIILLLFLNEK